MRALPIALAAGCAAAPATAGTLDGHDLAARVDEAELLSTLEELTGVVPVAPLGVEVLLDNRDVHNPGIAHAAAYVAGRFESLGLVTRRVPFACQGIPDLDNVVAEVPGARDAPPLVLTAHYDSIATLTEGGWDPLLDPAPGADDDASGVALLVEAARILAAAPLQTPVRLVAFSCEEYGLSGSEALAAEWAGTGEAIAGLVSFDPVGYNAWAGSGEEPWLWASHDDASADLAARWAGLAEEGVPGYRPEPVHEDLIGGDARSDHHPFQELGFVAMHAGGFPQPPAYHTTDDTVDGVDLAYLAAFTRSAVLLAADVAGLEDIADPPPGDDDDADPPPSAGDGCHCASGTAAAPREVSMSVLALATVAWGVTTRRRAGGNRGRTCRSDPFRPAAPYSGVRPGGTP